MTAVTNKHGVASVEAPLGRVEVRIGRVHEVAWIAVDVETVVELTLNTPAPA
jgi:hypothetical protein